MSIKRVLEDYCHFKKEQDEIRREIAQFRLAYKSRLKKIDENLSKLSQFIFLIHHHAPMRCKTSLETSMTSGRPGEQQRKGTDRQD